MSDVSTLYFLRLGVHCLQLGPRPRRESVKKKLHISKETVKTLSSKQLKQVGGGLEGGYSQNGNTCDPLAYAPASMNVCNMV
jgi:hypothetical protein